ncbi:hypothetical protein EIP86_008697 [Pleurotus ostreatoroseus]|nr:hypothetical protein EIP86_008697 [Pleurotus ostreatoroseus]
MNIWTEHRNPEGRTYWFNTGTRESVWEKPDDLKTPFERALNQTKWKEYFSGGRKYYYNTDTKESKWDMPDELLLLLEKVEKESQPANALVRTGISSGSTPSQGAANPLGGTDPSSPAGSQPTPGQNGDTTVGPHTGGLPFNNSSVLPARPNLPDDPVIPHNGFTTFEEGEKAFMHLLRKAGVDANWTWDQTMRAIITDPLYKALNTLAEKKATWQKYTENLKAKEQEEREARLSKLRPAIRNMLKGNPNVFHYTTFATADRLFAQHPIWQQAKIEAERKLVFEEYVAELKQREMQESRAARSRAISKVVSLFKRLEVDVTTRWRSAHTKVVESDEYREDEELQKLPNLDILLAFEDYSRVREREFEEQMRRAQVEKTRKERKAREAFKDLLRGLVDSGKIQARSKWKEVYPSFKDDKRYLAILGNPGSNPLELFWDVVDSLDQKLDEKIEIVETAIKKHNEKLAPADAENAAAKEKDVDMADDKDKEKVKEEGDPNAPNLFKVAPETTKAEFLSIVKRDEEVVKKLKQEDLEEVFDTLQESAIKQKADEKRRAERRQRHLQDDLRYALKKLPEPLDITLSYEDVSLIRPSQAVPLMQELPEYKALEDDEGRRAAFAKFVKRQKERLREREKDASEDGGSTTSRRRKEPAKDGDRERDRERDRDRDRDYRDRDRDREDRDGHHERESRSTRHHRGHDDHDSRGRHSSRDYARDRDYKDKDYHKSKDDKDRDYYRSSRHHKDYDREDRRRKGSRADAEYGREWDEPASFPPEVPYSEDRERSTSVYREERERDPREKRERSVYDDKLYEERPDKRARYDEPTEPERPQQPAAREETPEEGEI